ncbi:MAG: WhiB family transcriptional regulator [Acidimicrobiales bacterium]
MMTQAVTTRQQQAALEWQVRAACKGPQAAMFFPPDGAERKDEREDRERRAKLICAACPVNGPCLQYALAIREPHGIWGGLNEHERIARSTRNRH